MTDQAPIVEQYGVSDLVSRVEGVLQQSGLC